MFMKESKTAAVCQIIQNEQIKSVYQPIISLTDGKVLGYEALARITRTEPDVSIEEMFVLAEQCGKLWELIRLGISYGQGYLIAKPQEVPQTIAPEILQLVQWERRIAAKGAAAPVFQVQRDSFTRLPRSGG